MSRAYNDENTHIISETSIKYIHDTNIHLYHMRALCFFAFAAALLANGLPAALLANGLPAALHVEQWKPMGPVRCQGRGQRRTQQRRPLLHKKWSTDWAAARGPRERQEKAKGPKREQVPCKYRASTVQVPCKFRASSVQVPCIRVRMPRHQGPYA